MTAMDAHKSIFNPFSITTYIGSEYFCDRQNETEELHKAL